MLQISSNSERGGGAIRKLSRKRKTSSSILMSIYFPATDLIREFIYFNHVCSQVPRENTVQHPPLAPLSTRGIPNSLGLRLEVESRHFEGSGGTVIIIKCAAQVGSRDYSIERKVQMAHVNNQRLRGADGLNSSASRTRAGRLIPLLTAILALIPLTT